MRLAAEALRRDGTWRNIMRIGIVGGGERCLHLLELMEKHRFEELSPKVVVVAEESEDE